MRERFILIFCIFLFSCDNVSRDEHNKIKKSIANIVYPISFNKMLEHWGVTRDRISLNEISGRFNVTEYELIIDDVLFIRFSIQDKNPESDFDERAYVNNVRWVNRDQAESRKLKK